MEFEEYFFGITNYISIVYDHVWNKADYSTSKQIERPTLGPYYKSKLELKSNSSKILPVLQVYLWFYSNLDWQNSNLRS